MPLDDETLKKLHTYARNRHFDEKAFAYEVERAMHDLGMLLESAIPHAEKLFEESAYKAKAAGPKEAGRRCGGKTTVAPPAPTPKPAAATSPDLVDQYQKGMDEAQKFALTNYKKLLELADGGDYLELFASAGHGKSRFLAFIALEVIRAGKRVIFLDCEHSLPKRIQKQLGDSYKRLDFMDLDLLVDEVSKLPIGLDLICFDSIGFPVLISYAKMNMKQRGDALLKTILLRGYMKHYAENYDVLALGANQPKSDLWGASHDIKAEDLEEKTPPVGGKSIHIAKGVIRMSVESKKEGESTFGLRAFECQDLPFNKLIATFTINDKGERMEWKV